MRNLANLVFVACLLSLPALGYAQNAARIDDPFGADPFGGGKVTPPVVKQPKVKQVAQPKPVAQNATLKAKTIPARGSSEANLRIRAARR